MCIRDSFNDLEGSFDLISKDIKLNLESITQGVIQVYGITTLTLEIANRTCQFRFVIVGDNCDFEGNLILGCDLLSQTPLIFDFEDKKCYFKEESSTGLKVDVNNPIPLMVDKKVKLSAKMVDKECSDQRSNIICENRTSGSTENRWQQPKKNYKYARANRWQQQWNPVWHRGRRFNRYNNTKNWQRNR